ncbi:MAG: hypothetical protein IBX69_19420 [Anaerolineales bacterium]|nr:hypothetical protein [Anaerolineales bacterium]
MNDNLLTSARLLADRLERLSADSIWAHRASGVRGSLVRLISAIDQGNETDVNITRLDDLLEQGFDILEKAAKEYYGIKVIGGE